MTSASKFEVITACAPDPTCPICQAGRKRYRHTLHNQAGSQVTFQHIVKVSDSTFKLGLCAIQHDLTQRF